MHLRSIKPLVASGSLVSLATLMMACSVETTPGALPESPTATPSERVATLDEPLSSLSPIIFSPPAGPGHTLFAATHDWSARYLEVVDLDHFEHKYTLKFPGAEYLDQPADFVVGPKATRVAFATYPVVVSEAYAASGYELSTYFVTIYDAQSGDFVASSPELYTLVPKGTHAAPPLAMSPDGTKVFATQASNNVFLTDLLALDVDTGKVKQTFPQKIHGVPSSLEISKAGNDAVSASSLSGKWYVQTLLGGELDSGGAAGACHGPTEAFFDGAPDVVTWDPCGFSKSILPGVWNIPFNVGPGPAHHALSQRDGISYVLTSNGLESFAMVWGGKLQVSYATTFGSNTLTTSPDGTRLYIAVHQETQHKSHNTLSVFTMDAGQLDSYQYSFERTGVTSMQAIDSAAVCQPKTCPEGFCGLTEDGCGGQLACNPCTPGNVCDAASKICVCEPKPCGFAEHWDTKVCACRPALP